MADVLFVEFKLQFTVQGGNLASGVAFVWEVVMGVERHWILVILVKHFKGLIRRGTSELTAVCHLYFN